MSSSEQIITILVSCILTFLPVLVLAPDPYSEMKDNNNNNNSFLDIPHLVQTKRNDNDDYIVGSTETSTIPGDRDPNSPFKVSPKICTFCSCDRPLHPDCLKLCCSEDNNNSKPNASGEIPLHQHDSEQKIPEATHEKTSQDFKESNVDDHPKISTVGAIDLSTPDHSELGSGNHSVSHQDNPESVSDCYSVTDPESGGPLPSKPDTFDSDDSNELNSVTNRAHSELMNRWTFVIIFALLITSLWSILRYFRQWRHYKMRENYLIDGLYSEARPLCLNDMLDYRE